MVLVRLKQAWAGSLRAAACALLGAVLVVAHGGHAFAQEDDDDDLTFEQKMIRNLLGGFGAAGTGAGIEYRERSPLVIPPSRNLPPPEANAAAKPATNWPTDPDKKRKLVKKQKKPLDARETKLWDDPGRPLTPAELNVGRTAGPSASATTRPGDSASENEAQSNRSLLPSMLGYTGGLFGSIWGTTKEETAQFTGEPPRTTLTAPPTGYMTPSPSQPYGIGVQKYTPKPINPADLPARSN